MTLVGRLVHGDIAMTASTQPILVSTCPCLAVMLGLGPRPQNSGLGFGLGVAFGGLGLEYCGLGLAGQVLALALADIAKLCYINSNI